MEKQKRTGRRAALLASCIVSLATISVGAFAAENTATNVYVASQTDAKVVKPSFPGGQAALIEYIRQNLKYPDTAMKANRQGRADVKFFVETDGSIDDVEIYNSAGDEALDAEAIRIVKAMPKWNPGTVNGEPARAKYILPLSFKLDNTANANSTANTSGATKASANTGNAANTKTANTRTVTKTTTNDKNHIYTVVEQMPMFPGGDAAMMKYLAANIKYPEVAAKNNVQGLVVVGFVIERDGSITDVNILRGVDPSLDKEAMRVVKAMPKWTPGKKDGSVVRVRYQVPVSFRLQ